MKKQIRHFMFALLATSAVLLYSCKNESDNITAAINIDGKVIITNEGKFPDGSGTISAFDRATKTVENNLFEMVNGRSLGNVVQSFTVFGTRAYICVNNANKIEVTDATTLKSIGTIADIELPRFFIGIDSTKGYVSTFNNAVKVVDLAHFAVTKSMPTGAGPERMCRVGNKVFVLNRGGLGNDSTITVIDVTNDEVIKTVQVGDNPSGIQMDNSGNLWIICSGIGFNGFPKPGDTKGRLISLDPNDYTIIKSFEFPDNERHPENLIINKSGDVLFYNHPEGIFKFSVSQDTLSTTPVIVHGNMFYGIGYDPVDEMICATDPLHYDQYGWVFRYGGSNYNPVDSFKVGMIPNGFWFSQPNIK